MMVNRIVFALLILAIGVVGFFAFNNFIYREKQAPNITPSITQIPTPSSEAAELTGFAFIQDFITSKDDEKSAMRAFEVLSENARMKVSPAFAGRDLAEFIGVEGFPEQGASVEDLQIKANEATLIVGLNYVSGRQLRAIHMITENGKWKVDRVEPLDSYPPES